MQLKNKLLIGPMVSAVVLVLSMSVTAWLVARSAQSLHAIDTHASQRDQALFQAQVGIGQEHASLYRTLVISASVDEQSTRTAYQRGMAAMRGHLDAVQRVIASESMADGQLAAAFGRYRKAADSALDMASVDVNTGITALQSADAEFTAMARSLDTVIQRVRSHDDDLKAAEQAGMRQLVLGMLVLAGAAAAAASLFAWFMQRYVTREIGRVAHMAQRVAEGRLDEEPLEISGQDELAALLTAQATMVHRLRDIVGQVRSASSFIRGTSGEVAQGNAELSRRTEQAAAQLQETASSMEQITMTVRESADAARQAEEIAGTASSAAVRGGDAVKQVAKGMDDIAASSAKVVEFVGLIDSIAFQTNILALNAAVEAARAGGQGRGFAVVAGEVRGLANRSAEAAKEIKTLIGVSAEKVQSGLRLAHDAGSTMEEIVSSAERACDMIRRISRATADESEGVGAVGQAVSELDNMTQQNAALVEQSAAAAHNLQEQALRLSQAVDMFRLADQGA